MVNLRTAERQALGKHFVSGAKEKTLVADLLRGRLTLSPHRTWSLPQEPTWSEDPFSDNNWQFQYHMLRWLDPLRRAGQNGNAQAAEAWERYARSWIETNPPGDSASRWAWIDMADGIRAMELCHGLGVVGEQDWLIRSLEQHRDWLSDPSHLKHGNHGLHQTLGLFVVSAVLEDQDSMDLAVDWLGQRLRDAWDDQGVNEEGSLAYHRMNYLWWQEAITRLDLEGVDRPEGAHRLDLAPEEMAHATTPLGNLTRLGDTNAASIRDIEHPYAQYVSSGGARGAAPATTTAIYDRGYAYIRSGWGQDRPFAEETCISAVFGAQDKIHGHVDGGSLTCCAQGVQWLDDAGRYYYGRHPMQDYMKSRAAHSLVVLPDRTADKSTPVELVRSEVTDDCTDLLLSDASYNGVRINRRVVYLRHWDLTVVLDRVESEEPVQAEQRWHCGRDVTARALSTGFALSRQDKTFHISALTSGQRRDIRSGQEKPLVGWTATGWRKSTPVDVGTVYDEGTQLTFGALLGAWTPMAVDLLTRRLASSSDITVPVRDLIPAALLHSPWPGARSAAARRKPAVLEVSAQVVGPETVKVVADGPGRYFAFDLYDGKRPVHRVPWLSRGELTLDLRGVTDSRLHVKNRTTPADLQHLSVTGSDWALESMGPGTTRPQAAGNEARATMVNLESAQRQAIGHHFMARKDDEAVAAGLLGGRLTMPPHKEWVLPAHPTWSENPFDDNNWQFQYHMLRWLDPLRRTAQAGDQEAAEAWSRYARSWIETNPPGKGASRWPWTDMADGVRAMELSFGLLAVGEQEWLIRSLEQHRDWLQDPKHIKHGNHALHQILGLFVVSAVLEDTAAMSTAVSWLGGRLRSSWDEQGVSEEGSVAYHRLNYSWWQEAMTRLDLEGVERPDGAQRLDLIPEVLSQATTPLGYLARIGDTNTSRLRGIQHPAAQYAQSFGRQGTAPSSTTAVYDQGYAFVRSGWGQDRPFAQETYLTAMFGRQNKIHGHSDGGSVTFCADGVQWLDNGGRYYYGQDPLQDYMKSRRSHSLIVVPGREARRDRPVQLEHHEDTDAYTDFIFSDGSYDDVQISRRITYLKKWDLTLILDRVQSDSPVKAEQRWHCGQGVMATALSSGFALRRAKKTMHVAALTDKQRKDVRNGLMKPLIGWTSTGWRTSAPVDVGTVYDRGTDMIFGALLGAWSSPAVQLLKQKLKDVDDIAISVHELVPAALLREPWQGSEVPPRKRRSQSLDAELDWVAEDTLRINAAGPGAHFRFDVYGDGERLSVGSWSRSHELTLQVPMSSDPQVQIWNRKSPTETQSILAQAPRERSGLPELVSEPPLPDEPMSRTLVLIETMFCDNEQDESVLVKYFERFKVSLSSLLAQRVPEDVELLVTIYMSSDKQKWIHRTRRIIESASPSPRARYRIHEYDHPAEGYPQRDHIDWLKNPNKQGPYRSGHFTAAHSDIRFEEYGRLIRAAIDDDDLMLRHHAESLVKMASAAHAEFSEDPIMALGPLHTYIGYVEDSHVRVQDVDMRRSMGGNRCFVIERPSEVDLAPLSPWSIPEIIDVYQGSVAEKRGFRLSYVRGHTPGLVYMRWGSNLSAHTKDIHVMEKHGEFTLDEVEDVLALDDAKFQGDHGMSFGLLPPDLRLTVKRNGDSLTVVTNFDRLRLRNAQICFYLMSAGKRVAVRNYSEVPRTTFPQAPGKAQIIGFIRFQGEIIARVASERV